MSEIASSKAPAARSYKAYKRSRRSLALAAAAGAMCSTATLAIAQTDTWVGNTSINWADSNWSGTNNPPVSGDSLIFGPAGTSGVNLNNNLTSPTFNLSGITFNTSASAYVIGNGTAGLGGNRGNAFNLTGPITNSSVNAQTINDAFTPSGIQTLTTTTGGGDLLLGGPITGAGGLTFAGSGTTTITNHNTYTGGTTVNGGTVTLINGGAAGTILGVLNINTGGSVMLNTGDDLGYNGGASVTVVNINGGSIVDANNNNEGYITNFNLSGGTMSSLAGGAYNFNTNFGISSLSSGTVSAVTAPISIRGGAFPVNVAQGTTGSGVDLNITGNIIGGGPLIKSGAGTLLISGNDTYTGGTQVASGNLLVGAGTVWNTSSALSVGTTASTASLTIAGGTVNYTGGNPIIGAAAGSTSNFTMTGGTFNSGSGITIYFDNAGPGVTTANATLSNNAVFNTPAAGFILGQYGDTASAANTSTATLTLSGTSVLNTSYIVLGCNNGSAYENGIINLNGGTITTGSIRRGNTLVATSATAEVINANGGTLQATGNNNDYLTGLFVNLAAGGLTFNTATYTVNLSNAMSGAGGLTKTGTGILSVSGSNTYTGSTNITAGTLSVGFGGTTGTLPLASQIVDSSILAFNRSNTAAQGVDFPVISGSGSVAQNGVGVTQFSLNNTYTGITAINAGVLEFANAQALYSGNQASLTPANIQIAPGAALGVLLGAGGFSPADAATFFGQLSAAGVFPANSSIAIDPGSGSATYPSVIANSNNGALGFVKVGSGSLTLTGSNTYTGGTKVTNGTLVLGSVSAFGPAGSAVTVSGTGLIGITSDSQIADANFNLTNYPVTYTGGTGISLQNYNSSLSFTNITNVRLGAATGTASALLGNVSGATNLTYFGPGMLTLAGSVQSKQLAVRQGTLILSGTNASVNATAFSSIGLSAGDNASLVLQNGAVFTSTSDLNISDTTGATPNTGVVTIADSTSGLNVANLYVGKGNAAVNPANNVGVLNQLAGNTTVATNLLIGQYGTGIYNLSGGTLTMNGGSFNIGTQPGATGLLNISGTGALNDASNGTIYLDNAGGPGVTAAITVAGNGAFNAPNAVLALGQFASSTTPVNASTATLTVQDNSTVAVSAILLGGRNFAFYTDPIINLNGGTIITGSIQMGATLLAASPTAVVLNANGGTIQATGANPNYFKGDYINLLTGGLNFNTAGYSVTSTTAMSGVGGFKKSGLGAFTVTGSNTYAGPTNVSGGALLIQNDAALPAGNNVIVGRGAVLVAVDQGVVNETSSINMNGSMIVYGGDIQHTTALVAAGYNNGNWNGTSGIFSSAAASDSTHLTAVGVIVNDDGSGNGNALFSTFAGQPTIDGDLLVKYTYYGDANLDGKVDGSDYTRIDNGYLQHLTGWNNGDFNYDGVIDGSDYTLIDNVFNTQGAAIQAQIASPTAQFAGSGTTSAVPEPASLGLLGIGFAALLGRRRRSC